MAHTSKTSKPGKERRKEKIPHVKHTTILSSNVLPCSYVTEGRLSHASTFHISHLFISYLFFRWRFFFSFSLSLSLCVHLFHSDYKICTCRKYKCDNCMHLFRSFHSGMPFIFGIKCNLDLIFWQNRSCYSSLFQPTPYAYSQNSFNLVNIYAMNICFFMPWFRNIFASNAKTLMNGFILQLIM